MKTHKQAYKQTQPQT